MVELAIRLVFSLAVVVGLLVVLSRFAGRRMGGRRTGAVRVVHRQALGRSSGIAVVVVGGRTLVLGTTEQQVTLLAELTGPEAEAFEPTTPAAGERPARTGRPLLAGMPAMPWSRRPAEARLDDEAAWDEDDEPSYDDQPSPPVPPTPQPAYGAAPVPAPPYGGPTPQDAVALVALTEILRPDVLELHAPVLPVPAAVVPVAPAVAPVTAAVADPVAAAAAVLATAASRAAARRATSPDVPSTPVAVNEPLSSGLQPRTRAEARALREYEERHRRKERRRGAPRTRPARSAAPAARPAARPAPRPAPARRTGPDPAFEREMHSALAGSLLAPQTWRDAALAVTGRAR